MFTTLEALTEEIESRIDVKQVASYLNFKKGSGENSFFCGLHDNKNTPSFIASEGRQTWKCFSHCGTGNIYQLVEKFKKISYIEAVKELAIFSGINESDIALADETTKLSQNLKNLSPEHLTYLNNRGISKEICEKRGLKSFGEYIVFPQILNNNLVGYKYLSNKDKNKKYFKGINTSSKLYPDNDFEDYEIVIFTAGEWDCLVLEDQIDKERKKGNIEKKIKVVTNTTGEGSIPQNLISYLQKIKTIEAFKIFYDHDEAGKKGSLKLANALASLGKDIDIFYFSDEKAKGYDVSDHFKEGNTLDDLFSLQKERFNPKMNERSEGDQNKLEKSILNFILINNEYINDAQKLIQISDLKDYRFSALFQNIKFLYEKYKYCDFELLKKKTKDVSIKESIDEVIGAEALGSFLEFKEDVEKLKEFSTIRNLQRFSNFINLAIKKEQTRQELLIEVGKQYQRILSESTLDERGKDLFSILTNFTENFDLPEENDRYFPTGYKEFDLVLGGGLRRRKLSVIGAMPSIGKTTWAFQYARYLSEQGYKVVYYASETEEDESAEMTLSARTGVSNYWIRKRTLEHEDLKAQELFPMHIKETDKNLIFVETYGMTLTDVENDIRVKKRTLNIDFAVIDLIQAFKTEKGYSNRTEYMSDKASTLVDLPKEEDIGLLCVSHLKVPETPAIVPKRPKLEDLANTSELGRRAYLTFFLHSEDKKTPKVEIVIRKNRNGTADEILNINFVRHLSKFTEPTPSQVEKKE